MTYPDPDDEEEADELEEDEWDGEEEDDDWGDDKDSLTVKDTGMLKEFLEFICEKAVDAETPKLIDIGDARHKMVSNLKPLVDVPPPVRDHKILGIADFMEAVKKWGHPASPDVTEVSGVVFHSPRKLQLVVDDEDRRDFVTMSLVESDTFKFLRCVGSKRWTHAQFVDILKNQLRGKVNDGLLPLVRKLDVSSGSKVSADIQQGRERGTREFMEELANADKLPEVLDVSCAVYSNAGLRTSRIVRCSLDVILPALEFTLRPLPDELEIAVEDAQNEIHSMLTGELSETTVLFGEFN